MANEVEVFHTKTCLLFNNTLVDSASVVPGGWRRRVFNVESVSAYKSVCTKIVLLRNTAQFFS